MKLDDAIRRGLRDAGDSVRFDQARWEGEVPLGARAPAPRIRRWISAAAVAALLVGAVAVPLALLSPLGGRGGDLGPGSSRLEGHGLSIELPAGWEGRISSSAGEGFGPSLHLSNAPLPEEIDGDVYGPFEGLVPGEIVVILQEVVVDGLAEGSYPPLNDDPAIAVEDVQRFGEGWASQVHSYIRAEFSISGRKFNFAAGFGDEPTASLIEETNGVLATLEVEPSDPAGHRTEGDIEDGLTVTIPAEWGFDADPTQPIEPENVLAFGSWSFPSGGVCAPFAALDQLPSDGAFAWLIEYHGTDRPEEFVPRPDRFDLADFTFGETSCEGTPMYQLRFQDADRLFQWQVAFGPQASEATEEEAILALESLRIGGVCDAEGDGYAPEVVPASGIAGMEATITGEVPHGEGGPGGPTDPPEPTTWIEVWWNLAPGIGEGRWASALPGGEDPIAARPGSPVLKLGRIDVAGSCTYELVFTVPASTADAYPVVVLYGGGRATAALVPASFEVTS